MYLSLFDYNYVKGGEQSRKVVHENSILDKKVNKMVLLLIQMATFSSGMDN